MSDFSQLKTLAQMLKPLGEMIPLIEKAESCEQAVRVSEAKLHKIRKECEDSAKRLEESNRLVELRKQEAADLTTTARVNYDQTVAEADKEAREIVSEAKGILDRAKENASKMIVEAQERVRTIDATIASKLKEAERLDGKIEKLKADLRKLLASAE